VRPRLGDRFRWWLGERLAGVPGVLRDDGRTPHGYGRYVNRISGHWIIR
jgi:hypothetical protein